MPDFAEIAPDLERSGSNCPRGPSATRAPASRCSPNPGHRRTPEEKIADAARVHLMTGCAPSVALHIPWDRVDDFDKLRRLAGDLGIRIGTINTNTFQDDDYKLGSLTHVEDRIRAKAIAHMHECIDIMNVVGSRDLKIWLPDGTNYPGQGDFRRPPGEAGRVAPRGLPPARPTATPGARVQAVRAGLLLDGRPGLGHVVRAVRWRWVTVPSSASTPGITRRGPTSSSSWPSSCDSGGWARSTSTLASTPTTISSSEPPIRSSSSGSSTRWSGAAVSDESSGVVFMLDQCHNIEEKIPGQIRSVLNVQEMLTRALLVDRAALATAQRDGDVLGANTVFMDAFYTDVRPVLAEWRAARGLPADPMETYRRSGYAERIVSERIGGSQLSWGA